MSLQSINDLLLQVLSEMKEMRQEINDLKRTISDMKSPIKEPLSHFHHQVASVDSRSSTTKQLPDLTVKPLTSPRKVVSKPNQHLMFEQKLDLLRQCSETVPLPPHPTNNSSLSEMVVDNKFINQNQHKIVFVHSLVKHPKICLGCFYGYWLKCDKSYKIDSSIYEFFDNTVNAFKMNAGQYTRITAWLCE
ncbi:hypothetical protein QTN25_009837 [Entamoeba marina]